VTLPEAGRNKVRAPLPASGIACSNNPDLIIAGCRGLPHQADLSGLKNIYISFSLVNWALFPVRQKMVCRFTFIPSFNPYK
jgi:hypothetical protein